MTRKQKMSNSVQPPCSSSPSVEPRDNDGSGKWLTYYSLASIVALLTFLVYLPALRNGFVNWDDDVYVYANSAIRSLKSAFFAWAFTDLSAGFWHPLTWISYAVDYAVWGLNPLGYHLSAILIHTLNTSLVVLLTGRLLNAARHAGTITSFPHDHGVLVVAGITGLLFGIHPLHVESVAWISERKDLLSAFFFLLSLIAYLRYAGNRATLSKQWAFPRCLGNTWYLMALALFCCALAAKTMAVSLPVVLLLIDWYPLGRVRSLKESLAVLLEKLPFIIGSLAIAVVSILAQKSIGALVLMDSKPLWTRTLVAFKALATYLWKMLLPLDLLPFYPYPLQVSLLSPEFFLPVLLVVGITVGCFATVGTRKVVLASWGYYLVTLLPVLGFVQVGNFAMADRFTYLPSLGPFLLLGLGGAIILNKAAASRALVNGALAGTVVLVAALSYATVKQISVWQSSISLWNYVIEKEPRRILNAYLNRGVAFGDRKEFDRAIEDFTTALGIDPQSGSHYLNRGMAYVSKGELARAIADYDRALALDSRYVDAYVNRGSVWLRKKEFDRALADYDRALTLQPGFVPALINRGLVFREKGETFKAIEDFSRAIFLSPEARVFLIRGDLYLKTGDVERAVKDYQKACDLGSKEGCSKAFFPIQTLFPPP